MGSTVVLLVVLALLWGFSCYQFWSSSPELRDSFVGSDDSEPPFFDSDARGSSKTSLMPQLGADGDVRAVIAYQKVVDYLDWGTGLELDIEDPMTGRIYWRDEERLARTDEFEGAAVLAISATKDGRSPQLEALLIGRSSEHQAVFGWLDLSKPFQMPALQPYSADAELLRSWMCVGRTVALAGESGGALIFLELIPWFTRGVESRWIRIPLEVRDGRWHPGPWRWVSSPDIRRTSAAISVRTAELPTETLFLSPTDRGIDLLRLGAQGDVQLVDGTSPVSLVTGRAVLERHTMNDAIRQRIEFVPLPASKNEPRSRMRNPTLADRVSPGLVDGQTAWSLRSTLEEELDVLFVSAAASVEVLLLDRPTEPWAWRLPGSDTITIGRWPWVNAVDSDPALLWATSRSWPVAEVPMRWLGARDLPIADVPSRSPTGGD
ncbi:MAG: hypothetical protein GC161_14920 [Planctomycetaceae bacterium]|nr:hypothetical protein [Planctomycetaceae bacterium]